MALCVDGRYAAARSPPGRARRRRRRHGRFRQERAPHLPHRRLPKNRPPGHFCGPSLAARKWPRFGAHAFIPPHGGWPDSGRRIGPAKSSHRPPRSRQTRGNGHVEVGEFFGAHRAAQQNDRLPQFRREFVPPVDTAEARFTECPNTPRSEARACPATGGLPQEQAHGFLSSRFPCRQCGDTESIATNSLGEFAHHIRGRYDVDPRRNAEFRRDCRAAENRVVERPRARSHCATCRPRVAAMEGVARIHSRTRCLPDALDRERRTRSRGERNQNCVRATVHDVLPATARCARLSPFEARCAKWPRRVVPETTSGANSEQRYRAHVDQGHAASFAGAVLEIRVSLLWLRTRSGAPRHPMQSSHRTGSTPDGRTRASIAGRAPTLYHSTRAVTARVVVPFARSRGRRKCPTCSFCSSSAP